ncbi:MAG: hypothetical protein LLF97_12900 [Planctomycetaceae bacterium]|nr:hypothetical protein [Planctomycetaceae bacterium]
MLGKWMFRWWMALGALGAVAAVSHAASWSDLFSLRGVEADPEKSYVLSEDNGPWLIMACSFSGEGAEKQARELVYELRKRYKLPAYTYEGHFDPGEAEGRGLDEFGRPRKFAYMKYKDSKDKEKARHPKLTEMAVLVGNYSSADDEEAKKTLQKVKYATPDALAIKEGKKTNQTLTGWRILQRQVYEAMGSERKDLGPMGRAFLVPNPMLPPDYFAQRNVVDPLVADMNKSAEFNLLECPGRYTVQVATFRGETVIKQEDIRAIQEGRKMMKSGLADAADKAHRLAEALRIHGYEAYEFHDRTMSMVTVGSFQSIGSQDANGKMVLHPKVLRIIQVFGSDPNATQKLRPESEQILKSTGMDQYAHADVKSLVGIPFDLQPKPIQVPKRSFSTAMRGQP